MGSIFKKQCKYLPSAMVQSRRQVYCFLFADWMFVIAFMNSRCLENSVQFAVFSIQKNECNDAIALAVCGSNLLVIGEQMKNDTLAGIFGFMGAEIVCSMQLTLFSSLVVKYAGRHL